MSYHEARARATATFRRAMGQRGTSITKALPTETKAYEALRREGDLLFRVGLAASSWEGMGQYADAHPELVEAIRAECQADTVHKKETSVPSAFDELEQLTKRHMIDHPGTTEQAARDHVGRTHRDLIDRQRQESLRKTAHVAKQVVIKREPPEPGYVTLMKRRVADLQAGGLTHGEAMATWLGTEEGKAAQAQYQHDVRLRR
jgi:hypothetical protein